MEADDPLDAEFGLGPEEIVAACVLATYMVDRREGALIARFAFRWARGWIRVRCFFFVVRSRSDGKHYSCCHQRLQE